jgi:hypothetical protein
MKAIINGVNVSISKLRYQSTDRIALCADAEEEPFAVLTVNLPDAIMEEDEAAIDVNNLGNGIIAQLVSQSIIENPKGDKWAQSGYVNYPICKVLI